VGLKHIFMLKMAHHEVPDIAGVPVPKDETQRTHYYPAPTCCPRRSRTNRTSCGSRRGDGLQLGQQNLMCQMVHENRNSQLHLSPEHLSLALPQQGAGPQRCEPIVTKLGNRCAHYTMQPTWTSLFSTVPVTVEPTLRAFIKMRGEERINPSDNKAKRNRRTSTRSTRPTRHRWPSLSSRARAATSSFSDYLKLRR
jgi:hypothetical protein